MPTLFEVLTKHKNNHHDRKTFGLVLQGGGMRAAYSCAATTPMIAAGFSDDTFEHIVGSSAGAINGAYFLSANEEAFKIYTDDITNKNFVSLARPNKIVDIDYLIDTVLTHKRPADLNKLRATKTKLHVILTNAKSGRKKVISNHQQFEQIYEEFRATAALPLLYDKAVTVDGEQYVDGGVADLLPIDVAIKLGCTDIVVIMTQQIANYHFDKRHSRLVKRLARHFAHNQSLAVRKQLVTNERLLQANLRSLKPPFKKIRVYVLEPSDASKLISLGNIDKPKVEALAQMGITDMESFLNTQVI